MRKVTSDLFFFLIKFMYVSFKYGRHFKGVFLVGIMAIVGQGVPEGPSQLH